MDDFKTTTEYETYLGRRRDGTSLWCYCGSFIHKLEGRSPFDRPSARTETIDEARNDRLVARGTWAELGRIATLPLCADIGIVVTETETGDVIAASPAVLIGHFIGVVKQEEPTSYAQS